MKSVTAAAIALVTHCATAFADPPPAQLKVRFELREAQTTRSFTVMVSKDSPCATAHGRPPSNQFRIKACMAEAGRLDIDWFTNGPAGEYSSTSSVPAKPGTTVELGAENGPKLVVAVQ